MPYKENVLRVRELTPEEAESRRLACEILNYCIMITHDSDMEISCEYHANWDTLRVSVYTKGEQHFIKTHNALECQWISRSGGCNMLPVSEQMYTVRALLDLCRREGYENKEVINGLERIISEYDSR